MLKNLVIVFETPAEAIFDQVMCILFRLTQKPSGSLVPLRDLLDKVQTKDGFKWEKQIIIFTYSLEDYLRN